MARFFALVNASNIVEDVIEADQADIDAHPADAGKQWKETVMDGSGGKNYAGIGYTYDSGMADFLSPKPFPSWVLSGNRWGAPSAKPNDGNMYQWDENALAWIAE